MICYVSISIFFSLRNSDSWILPEFVVNSCYLSRNFYFFFFDWKGIRWFFWEEDILIYFFVSFWRHGRVVRRGTANPFSPVQIRVSPDRQENQKGFLPFCWYRNLVFFPCGSKCRDRVLETCLIQNSTHR